MELILADATGNDIRRLEYIKADFDLFETFDFEITVSLEQWQKDIDFGCRIYEPNTETGGIIGEIITDTAEQCIMLKGLTWRGYLEKKIISPPAGSAYKKVSGELNKIIRETVDGEYSGILKGSNRNTGVNVTYQFNRYATIKSGLTKMLFTKNYRPDIRYIQGEKGAVGYVEVCAVPINDFSQTVELSQDTRLNFKMDIIKNQINHLIVLGDGELEKRRVLHLYLQKNGSIGKTQYYKGIEEISEVYEITNSENIEEDGIKHFEELLFPFSSFSMDVESLNLDMEIGDIIGGRDYITGNSISKAISGKIITDSDALSVEYKLEE